MAGIVNDSHSGTWVGVKPVPGSFIITKENKMAVEIFFICLFVLVGIVVVMDDAQWDRKK